MQAYQPLSVGRFQLGRFIGRGASGDVYEGLDPATGQRAAIKCIDCRRFRSIAELEAVQAEVALLGSLKHRHIVRLLTVQVTPSHIYLAMEHASGGTLDQYRKAQEGQRLTEEEALRMFLQIFQALEFCHRRCIVHRDLKPENILLDGDGTVKVADFGLASILTPFSGDVSNLAGTPEFMAPDLLVSSSYDGAKADLWSMGVMLYEALTGKTPFSGPSLPTILRAALKNEYPSLPGSISDDCKQLVAALLQPDPLRRVTVEGALQLPWLARELEKGMVQLLPELSLEDSGGEHVQQGQQAAAGHAERQQELDDGGGVSGGLQSSDAAMDGDFGRHAVGRGTSINNSHGGSFGRLQSEGSLHLQRSGSLCSQRSSLALQLPGGLNEELPSVAEESSMPSVAPEAQAAERPVSRGRAGGSGRGHSRQTTTPGSPGCDKAARHKTLPPARGRSLPRHATEPEPRRLVKSLSASAKLTAAVAAHHTGMACGGGQQKG